MDQTTALLSHQVFGPSARVNDGRVRSTAEGIIEKLRVYTWPRGVKDHQKLIVLAFMTAHGKSVSESPSSWATWVFSYVVLCFPEIQESISRMNGREYYFEPLPKRYIDSILALNDAAIDFDDSQPEEYGRHYHDVVFPPGFPEVTRETDSLPPDLAACATVPVVYGYCSLLIFLAGKQITERNSITITDKRPKNLVDSFKIDEYASFVLTGDGKMGSEAHRHINQVWITYFHARAAVITEVASFATGASLPQRVVYTITKLLEYSGMQPAYFIYKFLQARPETREFSCTRAALNAFISSVQEVAAAPGYLQPYYKLIHGESTRAFHRNTLLVLSSCAVALEKATSSSMRNFDLGEGATAAVNMYDAEATMRGYSTLADVSKAKEGQEEPTIQ